MVDHYVSSSRERQKKEKGIEEKMREKRNRGQWGNMQMTVLKEKKYKPPSLLAVISKP